MTRLPLLNSCAACGGASLPCFGCLQAEGDPARRSASAGCIAAGIRNKCAKAAVSWWQEEYVDDLLSKLGLTKAADTVVGDAKVRGISGGEKKRLSIGCELIASPNLVFAGAPMACPLTDPLPLGFGCPAPTMTFSSTGVRLSPLSRKKSTAVLRVRAPRIEAAKLSRCDLLIDRCAAESAQPQEVYCRAPRQGTSHRSSQAVSL